MAMGEWLFGHGRGTRSLAIVNGQVGVGAGLILDGKILRGSTFGAGELGHFSMLPEIGELCRCGKRGCLETLVSTVVLMSQTEKMIRAHPGTPLALAYNCAQNDGQRVACIFDAARARDQWAEPIVEKSAFYLGVALANLVNLFDPDMIVLNGIFCQAADLYLPVAEKTMRANAYAGIGDRVKMLATSFGANAGMVGAAALSLLYHFYRPIEY
jgi:glucokinase